jgi:hypothetical protein
MKFIKSINEYLSTDKRLYLKWYFNQISKDIESKLSIQDVNISNKSLDFKFNPDDSEKLTKILNIWVKRLINENLYLVYHFEANNDNSDCYVFFKTLRTQRIKPNRYVYHQTDVSNLNDILANGIKLSDSSNWDDPELAYPPAIFATDIMKDSNVKRNLFYADADDPDTVTLIIDTSIIKNKWYYDLNMYSGRHTKYIMTFEPIPPNAINILE